MVLLYYSPLRSDLLTGTGFSSISSGCSRRRLKKAMQKMPAMAFYIINAVMSEGR